MCHDSILFSNQLTAKGNLTLFLPFSRQKFAIMDRRSRGDEGVAVRGGPASFLHPFLFFPPPSLLPLFFLSCVGFCRDDWNNRERHKVVLNGLIHIEIDIYASFLRWHPELDTLTHFLLLWNCLRMNGMEWVRVLVQSQELHGKYWSISLGEIFVVKSDVYWQTWSK